MAKPRPLDEQFDEAYEQRASIQPSVGRVSGISKVERDLKNPYQRRDAKGRVVDPKKWRADSTSQVTVTEFKKTKKKADVVDLNEYREERERQAAGEAVVTGKRTREYREPVKRVPKNFVGNQYTKAKVRAKKKSTGKTDFAARRKASVVNSATMSWLVPSYFFVQLPFAILNLIFLGMYYVIASITTDEGEEEFDETTGEFVEPEKSWFWQGVDIAKDIVKGVVSSIFEAIEALTGFDFLGWIGVIPQKGYLLTVSILLGYSIFVLLIMGFMYMMAGLKPLSGKGGTSKVVAFMLCLFGYFAPFFNLFPWAVIWAATVWKNPK